MNKPESSKYLTIFILSISLFNITNIVVTDLIIFLRIPVSAADAAINRNGIQTLLAKS